MTKELENLQKELKKREKMKIITPVEAEKIKDFAEKVEQNPLLKVSEAHLALGKTSDFFSKLMAILLLIIVIAIATGGGWLAYNGYFKSENTQMCGNITSVCKEQYCQPSLSCPEPKINIPSCPQVNCNCWGNNS